MDARRQSKTENTTRKEAMREKEVRKVSHPIKKKREHVREREHKLMPGQEIPQMGV